MSERLVTFSYNGSGSCRLDKFLVECLPEFSRSRLQGLIKEGLVLVKGEPVNKTGFDLQPGMQVHVHIPPIEATSLQPESIPLDIIFENQDLMVVNKPAGMVVHPSAGHQSGTLVHAALSHAPEITGVGGEHRPGVVHRLDKNTSGVILLAKNDAAHIWLQDQFRLRRSEKIYLALVDGCPPTPNGRIEAPIGRATTQRKLMAVVPAYKGREAISEYRTLESFANHTYLEIHPITGRTHQIRLHLKFIGCPVVGDEVYGRRHSELLLDRHFLHAQRLTITLPGEQMPRTFEAPMPFELEVLLDQLRRAT